MIKAELYINKNFESHNNVRERNLSPLVYPGYPNHKPGKP